MTFSLRSAEVADLDAIHALRRAFYREDGSPWSEEPARDALAALLEDPRWGRVFAMVDDDTAAVVGFAVLTYSYSLEFLGRDAFVDELYVAPSARRRALGALALDAMERACVEQSVRALHLEVDRDNLGARALYRRWGFVDHARYLMTKWLVGADVQPR